MTRYIALFRGINVGGKNILPMKALVAILDGLGAQQAKTYIQSGNAVFDLDGADPTQFIADLRATIQQNHGFEPHVLLLTEDELARAIAANPFPEGADEPKTLHLYFLAAEPEAPDLKSLASLKHETERFALMQRVFYLHAPAGIGRSKLATRVEKALGVPATARNWRSVGKVMALAESM